MTKRKQEDTAMNSSWFVCLFVCLLACFLGLLRVSRSSRVVEDLNGRYMLED
jgi:hypothetical protein